MTLCVVFKHFNRLTLGPVTSYLERDFPCLGVIRLQTKKMKSGCEKLSLGLLQIEVCLLFKISFIPPPTNDLSKEIH